MLYQLVDVPHSFLINMFLRVGFSWYLRALMPWCGFHAAVDQAKVNGAYYCDVLLVRQLLLDTHLSSCWRLLLSGASRVHKSTVLLRHKSPDFTTDVASQQTRPQFCRLDYRLLTAIQECVYQRQQGTSNIVDELWSLTE